MLRREVEANNVLRLRGQALLAVFVGDLAQHAGFGRVGNLRRRDAVRIVGGRVLDRSDGDRGGMAVDAVVRGVARDLRLAYSLSLPSAWLRVNLSRFATASFSNEGQALPMLERTNEEAPTGDIELPETVGWAHVCFAGAFSSVNRRG